MKRLHSQVSRRNFLLAATAATAAGALLAKNGAQDPPATSKDDHARKGYQLTAHVQNYYRTAKI